MKISIEDFDPCEDEEEYYNSCETTKEFWDNCHRGDWLMWFAYELGANEKLLMKACIEQAKTVEKLMGHEYLCFLTDCEGYLEGTLSKGSMYDKYNSLFRYNLSSNVEKAALFVLFASYSTAYCTGEVMGCISDKERERNEMQTANIAREILSEEIYRILRGYQL